MNNSEKIRAMAMTAVFTAAMCVLAPVSLPIGPVPVSLGTLVLYFSAYILGVKKSAVSVVLYLIIGALGLPVFSGFTGGIAKLMGFTGGYLFGYIFLVIVSGAFIRLSGAKTLPSFIGMVLGTALLYAFGTAWLKTAADMTWAAALAAGVAPFIIGDLIKIILALIICPIITNRLKAAKLL